MGIVSTIPERCRRCYTCVRECPAKAIKVIAGQATVIEEQCIACGQCVKVCTQKAKRIEDSTMLVQRMLDGGGTVIACLAPSFPVAFAPVEPGRVVTALRKLGFAEVWETAFGAEMISGEYAELVRRAMRGGSPVISTPCPAIVSYVEKYLPALHGSLAPVVSPMIATARAVRQRHGEGVRIVFVGPCIAKKAEIRDPYVQGTVDAVLTFEELAEMLLAAGVDPAAEQPGGFDSPPCGTGRSIPLSGGLLRSTGFDADILQNSVLVTEGRERVLGALKELAEGTSRVRMLDVLFCEGCVNGPKMTSSLSMFARRELLTDHINEQNRGVMPRDPLDGPADLAGVDVRRGFSGQAVVLPQPSEEEIAEALRRMRKYTLEDQLNCGSCGYPSCREKAIAVCQGLAEVSMCLPYLVEELESTLQVLQRSHQATQDRLVQTERLASMGQISAGVAHEINNPLSTILLYSHMLLKAHRDGGPESDDLQMIVNEANRCRSIMRGLLDFARQSRVVKAPTDIGALIRDLVDTMLMKCAHQGQGGGPARVRAEIQPGMPLPLLDAEQVRQMLANLVQNGLDALPADGGEVVVSAGMDESRSVVVLKVRDTGSGMPPEMLSEIFTPFYTTKQLGKGTGMGLSIVYGVVKMHAGDISVDSEVGKGTTFTVRLPVAEKSREEIHERRQDSPSGG
jgi:signal transduction histidine kinase/NAD-dependent dihydropyrimidine dehydrogenase PreA subunit